MRPQILILLAALVVAGHAAQAESLTIDPPGTCDDVYAALSGQKNFSAKATVRLEAVSGAAADRPAACGALKTLNSEISAFSAMAAYCQINAGVFADKDDHSNDYRFAVGTARTIQSELQRKFRELGCTDTP